MSDGQRGTPVGAPATAAGARLLQSGRGATARGLRRLAPLLTALLLVACVADPTTSSGGRVTRADAAREAAEAFLDTYVDADGRVVRHDQGGDTVSEGQAYGLLLAQVAADDEAFARIWGWTAGNLQQPDGLLAWRLQGDRVVDANPASDADVLAAWALLRQGGRYREPGLRLAAAVLGAEVVEMPGTGPVLAAGPWATGAPATLNPSYWAPGVFVDLAGRTGDTRWAQLADVAVEVTETLTDHGRLLPPDWARVDGEVVSATPAPDGSTPEAQYGLDAQRLLVWLSAACDAPVRALAARSLPLLEAPDRVAALRLRPTGEILDDRVGALPLVASAAAADAAGREADRDRFLDRAAEVDAEYPSYYQGAWVALGRAILTTDLLDPCAR